MENKKDKTAQAAMEYLITYGWAILAVLIIGVALWQFGAFSPPKPPPGCSGFSEIKPIDWVAQKSTNKFILTITNEAGLKMNITGVAVNISDALCSADTTKFQLRPGERYTYQITCSQLSSQYELGEYYRAHIGINYTNPQSLISHSSRGDCWGVVE
ncbi:MAG: hypothetical protein QXY62_05770 [Candidatus Altiarchaeota archaeon]